MEVIVLQRPKRAAKIIVVFILLLMIAVATTVLLDGKNIDDDSRIRVSVYYLDMLQNKLVSEEHLIDNGDPRAVLEETLIMFASDSKNASYVNTSSEHTKFLVPPKIINGKRLEFDFTEDYHNMSAVEEMFFRGALVWTVTSLEFIKEVQIYVNGKSLISATGTPVGILTRDNFIVSPVISPEKIELKEVTLYFADKGRTGLKAEKRTIQVGAQELPRYVIEELILGPESAGLSSAIPTETRVRDVKIDQNICYVSLNGDFISRHVDDENAQRLTIYSIVNSLTELDNINKVQFLVEVGKIEGFRGGYDLTRPIDRMESLIIFEEEELEEFELED